MKAEDVPQLVAHRGDMTHYPENSWPALRAAVEAGACWLEFDIQMCADGRFVLLHDADFARTGGDARRVFDLDLAACRQVSVHQPTSFGNRFRPAPTPGLDEVLEWLSGLPGVRAMVEIKTESLEHFGHETVMRRLLPLLAAHRADCILISFDYDALDYAARHDGPELGWVLHAYDDAHRQRAERLQPHYLICNQRKAPRDAPLWGHDWRWMLYDIRTPETALEWSKRGIDLIETGDIVTLLQHPLLATRRCRHGL